MLHIPAHKYVGPHPPAQIPAPARHLYPSSNLPMSQFDRFPGMGFDVITVVDTSRYDAFFGFRRVVKQIRKEL